MAANKSMDSRRKQKIAASLFTHFSLDPEKFVGDIGESDFRKLYTDISKCADDGLPVKTNDDIMKWIAFAESFPEDSKAGMGILCDLNEELATKSVLLGNGLRPSEADVVVFAAVHSLVRALSNSDREKLPHVMRWMDYIQNVEGFRHLFEEILLEKDEFKPQVLSQGGKSESKTEEDPNMKKLTQNTKGVENSGADKNVKTADMNKVRGDKGATKEKNKSSDVEAVEKDKEVSVSLLNIQVGLIRKAWKHPSADSLLVEEIDVGDAKLRQVVSGLAKYCSPDDLANRYVVLITNVKPGKLRDMMSEGLVLCASNEDHTIVEPLLPPEGAKIGERVSFSGIDGKPEDVLNPKKKQLEKITPHLFTNENGVATFKGIPFMTSAGPCMSSIPKASIK